MRLLIGLLAMAIVLSAGCAPAVTPAAQPTGPGTLYVVNEASGNISVIDTAVNKVADTITVEGNPKGIALSPDGKILYVTLGDQNSVAVVDAGSNQVVASIPVGTDPQAIAVSRDGKRGYVTNYESSDVTVLNLESRKSLAAIKVGTNPQAIALSYDGATAYVVNLRSNNVSAIETTTGRVKATIPAGEGPCGISLTADGRYAYVGGHGGMGGATPMKGMDGAGGKDAAQKAGPNRDMRVLDLDTKEQVGSVTCGVMPVAMVLTPSARAYVANHGSNEVSVVDLSSRNVISTIPVGKNPSGIVLSKDGRRVYVSSRDAAEVSVIDDGSMKVVATVPVGEEPRGMAIK